MATPVQKHSQINLTNIGSDGFTLVQCNGTYYAVAFQPNLYDKVPSGNPIVANWNRATFGTDGQWYLDDHRMVGLFTRRKGPQVFRFIFQIRKLESYLIYYHREDRMQQVFHRHPLAYKRYVTSQCGSLNIFFYYLTMGCELKKSIIIALQHN